MDQLHNAGRADGEDGDDTGKPQENSDIMGMMSGFVDLRYVIVSPRGTKLLFQLQMLSEILNAITSVHLFDPCPDDGCRERQPLKSG
jgi:hypothetical protein